MTYITSITPPTKHYIIIYTRTWADIIYIYDYFYFYLESLFISYVITIIYFK